MYFEKCICLLLPAIRIDVCGVAVVRWDSDGSEFEADPDDKIKGDADREVYFNKRITFLERGEQGYSWLLGKNFVKTENHTVVPAI